MNEEAFQQDKRISIQIVEAEKAGPEVGRAWDDLFARATDAPPHLSRPWVTAFARGGMLRGNPLLILGWLGARLVVLFPLAVRKRLSIRIAEPIGTGHPSYLGLLLDPEYPQAVECMAEAIRTEKIFNLLCIEDLWSRDKATNALLTRLKQKNFSVWRVHRNVCFFIRLSGSYQEHIRKTKSAKSRHTLLRKDRRLREKHAVEVEYYDGEEITADVVRRIASIQEQSWMKRRGAAILGQPFYQKLLLTMARSGIAQAWLMTIDNADAAFVFALVAHGQLHYVWNAFKLEYTSSLSVGEFLTNWTIRDACNNSILMYDFGHGDAQYKRFWSTDEHTVYRVVAGLGAWGSLLATAHFILWRLARIESLRSLRRRMTRMLLGLPAIHYLVTWSVR